MALIHVEPEGLNLTARSLAQEYYFLADRLYDLRRSYYRLEMAWQGGDACEFLFEMNRLIDRMSVQLDQLMDLSLILSRQADAWDESDQRWAWTFREKH